METTTKLEIVSNLETFDEMYKGSYYTITGAGGDPNEWVEGYEKFLQQAGIGTPEKWYQFTGSQMNSKYGLTGEVAYPEDLTFLSFPLTGLNIGKLAIFKIKQEDRWFDDIVSNNERHLEED